VLRNEGGPLFERGLVLLCRADRAADEADLNTRDTASSSPPVCTTARSLESTAPPPAASVSRCLGPRISRTATAPAGIGVAGRRSWENAERAGFASQFKLLEGLPAVNRGSLE
jgi:hypothetical protein